MKIEIKMVVEAVILGRNDDYQPMFKQNLIACIRYNLRLFEGSKVKFKIIFVEWNPIEDKNYLSIELNRLFGDSICSYVVPNEIHKKLKKSSLEMMINFGFNVGTRRAQGDWILLTCGDIFLSKKVVEFIKNEPLDKGTVYRANRIEIRNDLDFSNITPNILENPRNTIFIPSITPPFYTQTGGDFLLINKNFFYKVRGYDESIRDRRLHLDSQFLLNMHYFEVRYQLIGNVYHISHSDVGVYEKRQGIGVRSVRQLFKIPYKNNAQWGLNNICEELIENNVFILKLSNNKELNKITKISFFSLIKWNINLLTFFYKVRYNYSFIHRIFLLPLSFIARIILYLHVEEIAKFKTIEEYLIKMRLFD